MNTYEKINQMCVEKDISLAALAAGTGIAGSVFTELKKGRTKQLSVSTLNKISAYFEVPPGFFIGEEKNEKKQESLNKRRLLFDIAAKVSEEDLDRLIKIAGVLVNESPPEA